MYELENKKYRFSRVNVKDALSVKSAIVILAKENATAQQTLQADEIISDIALKYLEVNLTGEFEKVDNEEMLGLSFENEFAIIEILATFQRHISGFMNSLPSFQQAKAKKK